MTLLIFQILSSIFGFANKLFLFLGKRSGWMLGFLAGIFFVIYFFLIGFTIYAVIQIGFSFLMLYGYFSHKAISKNARIVATTLLSLIAIGITFITFKGGLTLLEAISALLASWGTYFLASKNNRKGWSTFLIAHLILIYLTALKQQYISAVFQGLSAVVSVLGIMKEAKNVSGQQLLESFEL
jgi:hypothetical protein